jgi:hypothetical protein
MSIYRRAHQNWITLQQLRTYQLIEYKRTRVSQLSAEMSYLMPVQPSDPTASVIGTHTNAKTHANLLKKNVPFPHTALPIAVVKRVLSV